LVVGGSSGIGRAIACAFRDAGAVSHAWGTRDRAADYDQAHQLDRISPHDNIIAGAAYLRLMYDRFGYPGFFAAYNAGPQRYAMYLAGRRGLPLETRHYLVSATVQPTLPMASRPSLTPSPFASLARSPRSVPASPQSSPLFAILAQQ